MEKFLTDVELDRLKNNLVKDENCFEPDKGNFSCLFKEEQLCGLKVKNHFLFSNLTDEFLYDNLNFPSEKMVEFYQNISKSGIGLIFTGGITADGNSSKFDKFKSKSCNVRQVENNLNTLTEMVHTSGTKIFLTIKSVYGRADDKNKFMGLFPYSASNINSYKYSRFNCLRASDGRCDRIIDDICEIVRMANSTNFDGVVIDANLFGFIGEMSSIEFNKRNFGYYSEVYDFAVNLTNKIIEKNKDERIIFKITIASLINFVYQKNAKNIKTLRKTRKNQSNNEIFELISKLVNAGVDGFVFNFGTYETEFLSVFNGYENENLCSDLITEIREYIERCNLKNKFTEDVTIIVNDNYNCVKSMVKNLQNNVSKFIDVTKQIYSDNNYLLNIKTQKTSKLCIKCSICNDLSQKMNFVDCAINPTIFDKNLIKSEFYKNNRIAVVGAGVSGLNAALILAERGFNVDLFDSNETLNESGRKVEIFGYDELLTKYNDYLESKINDFKKENKIHVYLKTKFDLKSDYKSYYAIIVATGFHEKILGVPGAVLKNVKSIYDVLANKNYLEDINSVTINAKSELSLKLALFLAKNKKKVSIIVNDAEFLLNIPNDRLTYYLFVLKSFHVKVYLFAKIKQVQNDFVEIVVNSKIKSENFQVDILNLKSGSSFGYEAKAKNIDIDLFIYESEIYSNNRLYYELVNAGYTGQLYLIGNALQPLGIYDDIKSAYFVAKNL